MTTFEQLCLKDPELAELRDSVRKFLVADRDAFGWQPTVDAWHGQWDEGFSARLGDAGLLGLTIPAEYGGRELGHLHRYVVTEELLAAGAPVAAHWVADRQVAPGLLSYGTTEQRHRLLPQIVAGRLSSAIGMSEDGAGSDLAATRCKAIRAGGGWVLRGKKVWTTGAHRAHQIVVFARTSPHDPGDRHAGFSQFIVPRDSAGIHISPIELMSGEHHFNEVCFEDVFVSDANVLGNIGDGWHQVTAELSLERSGPERILSTAPLILDVIRALRSSTPVDDHTAIKIGHLLARAISLRQLSVGVATALAEGGDAAQWATLVKDLGTQFEQQSVELVAELVAVLEEEARDTAHLDSLLAVARVHAPMFTLRGGTNEVLRGVIARGMGLR
jgi:alkylation response protein AidB-like acyl-CoA dehydrogenase